MFAVEIYATVRRFVFVEGKSRREAARVFGLSRDTISKMCRYSAPPGYVRSKAPERPKLGPLVPVIDAILEADKTAPPKQRHTAKRIFERLRIEHGYAGGYTVVKDYVRIARARSREVFVPLVHPPGHAQVDFGECVGVIGGVRMKLHRFVSTCRSRTPVLADRVTFCGKRVGDSSTVGQRTLTPSILDSVNLGSNPGPPACARTRGKRRLVPDAVDWMLQIELLKHLETIWELPDEGVYEVRGPRRHFCRIDYCGREFIKPASCRELPGFRSESWR
jgi:hypothetical protein